MLPWEGCRDAGSTGGMPGNPSSSCAGLLPLLPPPRALRAALPSLQPRCPRGCSQTSAPSACLQQEPISPAGVEHGPQTGLASPWGPTQNPRGDSRTRPLPWPPGQGPLSSLSRVLQPHRNREHGEGAPGGCFSHGTPFPKPFAAPSSGKLDRPKKAKAAPGSSDSRGAQPSFRGTKAEIKITQDNAEELCPCLRPSPCPCLSSQLLF